MERRKVGKNEQTNARKEKRGRKEGRDAGREKKEYVEKLSGFSLLGTNISKARHYLYC